MIPRPCRLATERRQPTRIRPPGPPPDAWPGADPRLGAPLYLDQLGLWDSLLFSRPGSSPPDGPRFDPAGFVVRRLAARNSVATLDAFLARNHYTTGAGMRGMPIGLYRGDALLGVAVFARIARPRWARENFRLLPEDARRSVVARRHLTVTEAEYVALSRFALSATDEDGRPLGKGGASWFLARCLAGLEARNRALWVAQHALAAGRALSPEQLRLLREAAGADRGRGRGYIKAVASWSDPWHGHLGRITQILGFHWTGRTNRGRWAKEAVGLRSARRLSARMLAKATNPAEPGHVNAALRLAWEGGSVAISIGDDGPQHDAAWVREVAPSTAPEPVVLRAIRVAWSEWRRNNVSGDAPVVCRWIRGTGVEWRAFPPKHAYLVGLGAPYYRRCTEMRHVPLTARLQRETTMSSRGCRGDRRREFYPVAIPPDELNPALRGPHP